MASARTYIPDAMKIDDVTYWTECARKAEAELQAATGCTALNTAAKKLMMARRELKKLEQRAPTRKTAAVRPPSNGAPSAASS